LESIGIPFKFHWESMGIPSKFHWESMGISLEFHLESGGIHRNLIFLPFRRNPNGIPTFRGIPAESAGTHGGG